MTVEINVPNIGEDELEVTEIMVKIGDNININQSLIIVEGDKSSMEIPAPCSGIVTKINIHVGDKVQTGSLILLIDEQQYTSILPINDHKNIAHSIYTSTQNDTKKRAIYNNNINQKTHPELVIHATPLVRHMARKFGINLLKVKGSGRKGRILKEDVQNYMSNNTSVYRTNDIPSVQNTPLLPTTLSWPEIDFNKFGDTSAIKLSKIQKISGANLQRNWITLPHVTQFDEVDITNLENFRKKQNLEIANKNINCKITILVFVIKAVGKALAELPRFNSSLSQDGQTLILKKYINIGIAVNTSKGLLVPVLRDVNTKGIILLSQELTKISKIARSGNKLTPSNMQGGSFTISNLGGIGGTAFTPIVNVPEVAILGISKSLIKPIWNGKEFMPRLILPLSLSYDHRVIDGVDGAKFITLINKIMSDIRLLSM